MLAVRRQSAARVAFDKLRLTLLERRRHGLNGVTLSLSKGDATHGPLRAIQTIEYHRR